MEKIIGKVCIEMGIGAPHVIALPPAAADKFPEFGDNGIIAALPGTVHPEAVIDLFASVQAQDHIVAFPVGPVDDFIRDPHAIGSQGKAEILVLFLFDASGIGDQVFAYLKIDQGLPAEEIHLQIPAAAGMLDQEIQGTLTGLKGHQPVLALEMALGGKTVFTGQVAGMGHQQAEGLDDRRALFEIEGFVPVAVFGKELPHGPQFPDILQDLLRILPRHAPVSVFLKDPVAGGRLLHALIQAGDEIVGGIVCYMDAAAVNIQDNIVTV